MMLALSDWRQGFGRSLGSILSREMRLLLAQASMEDASSCLDILEHYSKTHADDIDQLWSLPMTQYWLPYLKGENPQIRRRLRALEKRRLTDGRGRPKQEPEESQDVAIARDVEAARHRLARAFDVYDQHRRLGGYRSSREVITRELEQQRYQAHEQSAVLTSRTLSGAAHRLVALKRRCSAASIQARASRGRKYLGRA
jgi:hypothetical protein